MVKTTSLVSLRSYAELKRRVKEALILDQQKIEQEKVQTYWQTGKLILDYLNEHKPAEKENAEYGKQVVIKLASDSTPLCGDGPGLRGFGGGLFETAGNFACLRRIGIKRRADDYSNRRFEFPAHARGCTPAEIPA